MQPGNVMWSRKAFAQKLISNSYLQEATELTMQIMWGKAFLVEATGRRKL